MSTESRCFAALNMTGQTFEIGKLFHPRSLPSYPLTLLPSYPQAKRHPPSSEAALTATIGAMFYTYLPSSAVRVTGADRLDFVQGQMTGHIKAAGSPGRVPALFLNTKGQIEYAAQIYRRDEDLYLHLAENQSQALLERFKKYIIFDAVTVQDLSETLSSLHLWGWGEGVLPKPLLEFQEGQDLTREIALPITDTQGMTFLASKINRSGTVGLDLHVLKRDLSSLLELIPLQEAPYSELQTARVEVGFPDALEDDFLGDLPQECGLDYAVSYAKGCYIGQEIMARLEARGNPRYHLVRVVGEDIPSHSPLILEGKTVGKTGLSLGYTALATVRRALDWNTPLEAGKVRVTLEPVDAQVNDIH
jgi:tRNA-modifying protein YgfZ